MTTEDEKENAASAPIDVESELVEDPRAKKDDAGAKKPVDRRLLLFGGAAALVALVLTGVLLVRKELKKEPAAAIVVAPAAESAAPAPQTLELPTNEPSAPSISSTSPEKIFNNAGAALKESAKAFENAKPSVQGTINELPPPPEGDGNNDLQRAAKEAAKALSKPPAEIDLSNPEAALQSLEDVAAATAAAPQEPDIPVAPPINEAAPVAPDQSSALEFARLEGSLAEYRQQADRQNGEIARLQGELAQLRAEGAPALRRAQTAVLFSALEEKAKSGAPYRAEYDAFSANAGGVGALAAHAESGLPTAALLITEFEGPMLAALKIAHRAGANGPVEKIGANLASLVKLRPAGPREGDDAISILSRADDAVQRGSIDEALSELAALDAVTRAPFDDWMDRARAHVDAATALINMRQTLIESGSATP